MVSFIDNIVGLVCLPLGVLLFFKAIGVVSLSSLFGVDLLLLGAIAIVAIQAANLIETHVMGEWIAISYVIHLLLLFPAIIYFIGRFVTLPAALASTLPMMISCFIISEGLYSFFF